MGRAALLRRLLEVGDRTNQRVTERPSRTVLGDEPCCLGGLEIGGLQPFAPKPCCDCVGCVLSCSSKQQERPSRSLRQACDSCAESTLHAAVHRDRLAERLSAGKLAGGESPRQLGERQRVARGKLEQAAPHRGGDGCPGGSVEHGLRVSPSQPLELEARQSPCFGLRELARAAGDHHRDLRVLELARDEQEGRARRLVEPLGVVDDRQDRSSTRRSAQHTADRHGHGQPVDAHSRLVEAERQTQCLLLRSRKRAEVLLDGEQKRLQCHERKVGGRLAARGAEDRHRRALLPLEVVEQHRLPDTGLAGQKQCRSVALLGAFRDRTKRGLLRLPAHEHGSSLGESLVQPKSHVPTVPVCPSPSPRASPATERCRHGPADG